jgi:hypothetical protein
MGWCSATEIMDAATGAADKLMHEMHEHWGMDPDRVPVEEARAEADEFMRPFIRAIADKLRAEDWDCVEEADAFDRFRQEMLGYDDQRMIDWYRTQLEEQDDPARLREYAEALAKLMEAN